MLYNCHIRGQKPFMYTVYGFLSLLNIFQHLRKTCNIIIPKYWILVCSLEWSTLCTPKPSPQKVYIQMPQNLADTPDTGHGVGLGTK